MALIIECFEEKGRRLKAIGLWGAAGGMGGALGAFIGGVFVEYTDWRVATLTFLLLGIMAFTDGKTLTAGLWVLSFALAAYGFVMAERRAVQPLLSLNLLRSRGVLGSSLVMFFGVALVLTSAAPSATGSVAQADAGFAAGMISTSQHYGAVIVMASLILSSEQFPILGLSAGRFNVGILGASVTCLIACATAFFALPRNTLRTPSLSQH